MADGKAEKVDLNEVDEQNTKPEETKYNADNIQILQEIGRAHV